MAAVAALATISAVVYIATQGSPSQRGELPPAAGAGPAPAAPVVSPAPAARPAIPTVSLPCVDDRAEMRIGRDSNGYATPFLCWGDRCIDDHLAAVPPPPPLPAAASPPLAVVGPDQVCTETRCDPLGPRLRAVLAKPDPDRHVSATRNHAAIVVVQSGFGKPDSIQLWNRVSDRRIDLGTSFLVDFGPPDTVPESIDVLGDRLLVSWDCHEWCSSEATILDARGRDTGGPSLEIRRAVSPGVSRIGASIFAAGEDRYLVFGLFGEVALIVRGRVVARTELVSSNWGPGAVEVQVLPSPDGEMDVKWCRNGACHVTSVKFLEENGSWELKFEDHLALPRCSDATSS